MYTVEEFLGTSLDIPAENFGSNGLKYYGEYIHEIVACI